MFAERIEPSLWVSQLATLDGGRWERAATSRGYRADELIVSPEQDSDNVYWLEKGLARLYRLSNSGAELTLGYARPGELVDRSDPWCETPGQVFARAITESQAIRMPRAAFVSLLDANASLTGAFGRQLARRLRCAHDRIETLVFHDVRTRVAKLVLDLARDFGRREGGLLTIELPLTQTELATWIGSSRQSVNVSLGSLEADGLIGRQRRRIVVYKPEHLERLALEEVPSV